MKSTESPSSNCKLGFSETVFSTVFGIGYSPFFPGTIASLVGLLCYVAVEKYIQYGSILILLVIIPLGIIFSGIYEKKRGMSDPPEIVVDEFCGQILCLVGSNTSIENLVLGFLIFRFLDILKPPPIKYLETFPRGWGIFLDDLFSGLIGFLILFFLRSLILF
ncbi:MAG: phosphatidylglycerophosphatase A [Nitrospinota bacterium]|nr:phosphatidylglycerophosphatase A [Nitrospinota bacterium]